MTTPAVAAPAASNTKVIALAVAGALGGFLFGFDSSVINGALDAIKSDFALDAFLTGFAVAVALLGCAVGAFLAGRLADRWGRIPVMIVGATLFVVSSLGAGFAFGVADLIVWRVLGGIGIGIASVVAPTYISEISPSGIRGRLGSLQQLAITVGIFAALLSDAMFAGAAGGEGEPFWFGLSAWRWMFLAAIVPGLVYGIVASRLPESPRYLVMKGRDAQAEALIHRVQPGVDAAGEVRVIRGAHRGRREDREGSHPARPRARAQEDRVARHHPVGVPAVRRAST